MSLYRIAFAVIFSALVLPKHSPAFAVERSFEIPEITETHSADKEADEIRQSRIAELMDRARERDIFEEAFGRPGRIFKNCKHVSDIVAPPPYMRVALTFDDGPDASGTPYILEILQKYHLKASFFMIGRSAAAHPELAQRVATAGHLIVGNHSWSHPHFPLIPVIEQINEIRQNLNLLHLYEKPMFFRFPFGDSTCESKKFAHALGYKIVGWHVDSCDWAFNKTGQVDSKDAQICGVQPQNTSNFIGHIVQQLHFRKGGILLMHEIQPNTIRQLDTLIQQLLHDGFSFGTIDEAGFRPSLD